jgi:phosphohistidine phosphatase
MPAIHVYLIRHGLAGEFGSYANDRERPLTEDGKQKTRLVAQRLANLGLKFDLILTSPLLRAQQTATILMESSLTSQMETVDYLASGAIAAWLDWLTSWQPGQHRSLALVGHEPTLSTWAEMLVWGESKGNLELKKAGIIGISLPDQTPPIGHSTLFWLAPPRFLR